MKLTEKQLKDLKKFSLILNALNMEDGVYYSYEYSDWNGGWGDLEGPRYRGKISNEPGFIPASVQEIFETIRNNFDINWFYDEQTGNDNGDLTFGLYAEKQEINVTYDRYQMNTEETVIEKTFQEVVDQPVPWYRQDREKEVDLLGNKDFINEMIDEYNADVEIHYEGSGDEGYFNNDVDQRLQGICYEILDLYHGGWENNEGSTGTIYINFKDQIIRLIHYNNFVEEIEETYMRFNY
jgi:hypothetical protein